MEREQEALKSLIEFLVAHGYPARSIVAEFQVGNLRADLAVVDRVTGKPIAIFELKQSRPPPSPRILVEQLATYAASLGDPSIPLYAVFPDTRPPGFRAVRLSGATGAPELAEGPIPEYALLANRYLQEAVQENRKEARSLTNMFWLMCWLLASVLIILLVLVMVQVIELGPDRLVLLGAIVALLILPFAGKLKILGVEFERLDETTRR